MKRLCIYTSWKICKNLKILRGVMMITFQVFLHVYIISYFPGYLKYMTFKKISYVFNKTKKTVLNSFYFYSGLRSPFSSFQPLSISDSLWPHGLQHVRPPCPSPTPRVYSNFIESVMPSSHLILCHPILCHPLLPCPQSFPASGSFPKNQFFTSGGQSTGLSASASVLPLNTQDYLL